MCTYYIIGGGPSLKGFDFNMLWDKNVLAINKAFLSVPWANAVYFSDKRFFEWFPSVVQHCGRKFTGDSRVQHSDITDCKFTGMLGLDREPWNLRHGNNSGHAAINLAFHFGAKRIILLGYDMGLVEGESHYHGGYEVDGKKVEVLERTYRDKMAPLFEPLAIDIKNRGVQVINACPQSKLEVFEKWTIEEALYAA